MKINILMIKLLKFLIIMQLKVVFIAIYGYEMKIGCFLSIIYSGFFLKYEILA